MRKFKIGDRVKRVSLIDGKISKYFEGEPFAVMGVNSFTVTDPNGDVHGNGYLELVAPIGPVVTETVTRIVPGVYGRVNVVEGYDYAGIHVEVSQFFCIKGPDQAELRAAAAVLTQLADALENAK